MGIATLYPIERTTLGETLYIGEPAEVDEDVQDWLDRVAANSGTVSAGTIAAVEAYVYGEKYDAVPTWSKLPRVNLCCGDQLAASVVPLNNTVGDALDTVVNLTGGDYSEALAWQTDGSSKRIRFGYVPSEATGGIGVYLRTTQGSNTTIRVLMGTRNAGSTQGYRLVANSTGAATASSGAVAGFWGGPIGSGSGLGASTTGGTLAGHWEVSRLSPTLLVLRFNGALVATQTASVTPASAVGEFTIFANNAEGTVAAYMVSGSKIAGYHVGSLTDAEAAAHYARVQTFNTALGRSV
jgi:hypothetical protein